ncbi:MAG: hypothetical protein K2W78_08375 [Xanthobacteraceae bacterium]|nr:hypothetical protein [Xanthobacteraceae bacterium]
MRLWRISMAVGGAMAFAIAFAALWPRAHQAGQVLLAQDDPVRLSDIQLDSALATADPDHAGAAIEQGIVQALASKDVDLAKSFSDLAGEKKIPISPAIRAQVDAAVAEHGTTASVAGRFAHGLVTGEADDAASLTGTLAGDLFVFGDVRDVLREGKRLVMGEDADRLVLGLASVGIAVTAATYLSAAGVAPVRAGLTMVKDARKVGRLGAGLTEWAGRSARGVIDTPALEQAVQTASITRPAKTVEAVKAAFKVEKAGGLVRLAKDVGRVGEKAGTQGALDVLRISDGPQDVARAARLAESKGGQTRAIIKILGRGALLLTAGAFNLAWWVFAALFALAGFIVSIKATTERLTLAALQRAKLKRVRRELALAQSNSA